MTSPSKGARRKSRKALRQPPYHRPTITKFLRQYKKNQSVIIVQEPSSHRGMPHKRFKGRSGHISGTRGKSYIVEIRDGNRVKKIISRPEHLRAI